MLSFCDNLVYLVLGILFLSDLCGSALIPHETLEVPSAWRRIGPVEPSRPLQMRIALTQSNLARAEELIMDVSHPQSPNYGQHYSAEEVETLFSPSEETIKAVEDWLLAYGVAEEEIEYNAKQGWLRFHIPASRAEALLETRYFVFENQKTGKTAIACDVYKVPRELTRHIDFVLPGAVLGQAIKPHFSASRNEPDPLYKIPKSCKTQGISQCDSCITPVCIRRRYGIPVPGARKPNPRNHFGMYETGYLLYRRRNRYPDLDTFFHHFAPNIPRGVQPQVRAIDGLPASTASSNNGGFEPSLDFEVAWPLIYPQNITLLQVPFARVGHDGTGPADLFDGLFDAIDKTYCTKHQGDFQSDYYTACGTVKPPNVISVSYGGNEHYYSLNYQKRQCNEFMKLGLQGISVFVASGDDGVTEYTPGFGEACLGGDKGKIFNPAYPSCPYITLVGGTQAVKNRSVDDPGFEVAWLLPKRGITYASGGGFSNVYSRPKYQDAAVKSFFRNHDPKYPFYKTDNQTGSLFAKHPPNGIYNRIGRAYPDVSALAQDVIVFTQAYGEEVGGSGFYFNGGTSAATPMWASVINRINEERLAVGKSPVGFINPVLYGHADAMNDITKGHSVGCGTKGFSAVKGWDPVTGLGTPNYPKLLKVFMSLP